MSGGLSTTRIGFYFSFVLWFFFPPVKSVCIFVVVVVVLCFLFLFLQGVILWVFVCLFV